MFRWMNVRAVDVVAATWYELWLLILPNPIMECCLTVHWNSRVMSLMKPMEETAPAFQPLPQPDLCSLPLASTLAQEIAFHLTGMVPASAQPTRARRRPRVAAMFAAPMAG